MHKAFVKLLLIIGLGCCISGHRPRVDGEVTGSCTSAEPPNLQSLPGAEFEHETTCAAGCNWKPVEMEDSNGDKCISDAKPVEEVITRTTLDPDSHSGSAGGALVLYSPKILEPFHRASRTLHLTGRDFFIKQNWADFGVAAVVWDAAVVLSEYLEAETKAGNLTLKGKRVIELGAGTGLVGMVTAVLNGEITVTDRESVLEPLRENINLNFPSVPTPSSSSSSSSLEAAVAAEIETQSSSAETHSSSSSRPVKEETSTVTETEVKGQRPPTVRALDWGEKLEEFPEPFDIIVGADIVYIEESFSALLQTMMHLSNEDTLLLLSCRIRYDRDTNFLKMLAGKFNVKQVFYDKDRGIYIYSAKKLPS